MRQSLPARRGTGTLAVAGLRQFNGGSTTVKPVPGPLASWASCHAGRITCVDSDNFLLLPLNIARNVRTFCTQASSHAVKSAYFSFISKY